MSAFTQTAHAQLDRHLEEVEHSIKKIFMGVDGYTQDSQRFQQDIRDQIRRSTAKRKTSAAGGAK